MAETLLIFGYTSVVLHKGPKLFTGCLFSSFLVEKTFHPVEHAHSMTMT